MSGVITAATIATAAAAVGSTAYGIVQGERQNSAQQKALKSQNTAQGQAAAAALSTQRKNEVAQNQANQKTPDIASILARAAGPSKSGVGSTMLTGSSGIDTSALSLGKSSLLGA